MKTKQAIHFLFALTLLISCKKNENVPNQNSPCDVVQVLHDPNPPVYWSPDKSKFMVNKQDTAGIFQIYVGNAGDTTLTNISSAHTNGNCCGLFRHWKTRNKLQVQWHPSGNYIVCVVEKEFYPELLYTPYSLLLGWLQSGIWMDVWAVTPNGSNWYHLATTEHGVTGPAFTPDGSKAAWAEALNGSNLAVDIFGKWKLQLSNFTVSNGTPSFSSTNDISPQGARWLEPGGFSPDGRSLLLSSDIGMINAEGQDQYILDIITGQVTNLNNSPMIWDEHGVFSPDGKKILFMSSYPYRADTNSYHTLSIKTEFMLMNKDGSGLQQLTHFRTPGYPESSPGIAAIGFWTPDGTTIYAKTLVFPDFDNWIIKFKGNCGKQ
jgi:Tol biopolymer transport system component